ncbi:MAG TPA: substrate-binding domain-containing protein [Chthoniobacteraceae bacterium]|nr:substrate-binding domain-containing protein [Chthoniobacteraceae bacterium]
MKPAPHDLPFRPRAFQIAEYLQKQVRAGQWSEQLPPERVLAAQLGVSRGVVRAALAVLQEQGIVTERSRRGTLVRKLSAQVSTGQLTVGILLLMKLEQTTHRTMAWINELRRLLYQKQVRVEIYDGYLRKPKFFRNLGSHAQHDAWVMVYPNHEALRWSLRTGIRAVVGGTVDVSLGLPSVDIHYRAIGRHAAGRLAALGHRRLAFVVDRREWGADQETAAGLMEGAAAHPGMTTHVYHHNGSPEGICALTDQLLNMKQRPTGWLTAVAHHSLTILMHLQRRRVALPGDLSLIIQDAEPWQRFASPEPTRYVANVAQLAQATAREVLRLLAGGSSQGKPQRILPELTPGETLGPAPAD